MRMSLAELKRKALEPGFAPNSSFIEDFADAVVNDPSCIPWAIEALRIIPKSEVALSSLSAKIGAHRILHGIAGQMTAEQAPAFFPHLNRLYGSDWNQGILIALAKNPQIPIVWFTDLTKFPSLASSTASKIEVIVPEMLTARGETDTSTYLVAAVTHPKLIAWSEDRVRELGRILGASASGPAFSASRDALLEKADARSIRALPSSFWRVLSHESPSPRAADAALAKISTLPPRGFQEGEALGTLLSVARPMTRNSFLLSAGSRVAGSLALRKAIQHLAELRIEGFGLFWWKNRKRIFSDSDLKYNDEIPEIDRKTWRAMRWGERFRAILPF